MSDFRADARAVSEIAEETKRRQQRRHHSVHEQLSTRLPSIDYSDHPRVRLSLNIIIIHQRPWMRK